MDSTTTLKAKAKSFGIKLEEISKHTGLSVSQISRILNNKTVLKNNKEKIKEVILKLIKEKKTQPDFIPINECLPEINKLVWLSDGKEVFLGCRYNTPDGWLWAKSDGITYFNNKGEIVSDCYLEDIEVKYWAPLPKL